MSELVSFMARNLPLKTRNKFKVFCAENQVSMSEALQVLMEIATERDLQIKLRVAKNRLKNGNKNESNKSSKQV